MRFAQAGIEFNFEYQNSFQETGLNVAAKIYNVSSGTAVFVTTVSMPEIVNGCYSGGFTGIAGQTYMVICLVFTTNSYLTPDTNYAPETFFYQMVTGIVSFLAWDYTAFDQSSSLFPQSKIYDSTSGTPILLGTVNLAYVAFGVYWASYAATPKTSYQIVTPVYTDDTYLMVNDLRAPAAESMQSLFISTFIQTATLLGQSLNAVLQGHI